MHVGYFAMELPDSGASNGIVTYVRIMRDALRSLGHKVTVVTPSAVEHANGDVEAITGPSRGQLLRARLARPDGGPSFGRAAVAKAFQVAVRAGVDVFEIEESFGWARMLKGVPIVVRLHGPHALLRPFLEFSRRRAKAELDALKRVDAISAPTIGLLEALAERTSWRLGRVIKNPTPIPEDSWSASDADPDQILFVGRMDRLKGADIALEAFALTRRERPSLKLWMAGPGDPLPATENVQFLGQLQPAELHRLRLRSSLQLCTSRFENFPYSIAEAMALGMPVLSSDTFGGIALIHDGETGCLVEDRDQLPSAIIEMMDFETLRRLGRNARQSALVDLDPIGIAQQSLELYSAVTSAADEEGRGRASTGTLGTRSASPRSAQPS